LILRKDVKNSKDLADKIAKEVDYLYIVQNQNISSVLSTLNIDDGVFRYIQEVYGIKKDRKLIAQSSQQTVQSKYGCSNISQIDGVREKKVETCRKNFGVDYPGQSSSVRVKMAQTCLDSHGIDNPFHDQLKIREAVFNKFGVDNVMKVEHIKQKLGSNNLARTGYAWPMSNPDILMKRNVTNQQRYGGNSPLCSDEVIKKQQDTMFECYGVKNATQTHLSKESIEILSNRASLLAFILSFDEIDRTVSTISCELGYSYIHVVQVIHNYNLDEYIQWNCYTLGENAIKSLLDSYGISYMCHRRDIISPYELDVYLPEYNVAIEFNGTYWHSSLFLPNDYHYIKSKLCEEKNIRLIHIWEYEWKNERQRYVLENIILSACGLSKRVYARNCSIDVRKSSEMVEFFNTNNVQGFRGGKFSICLVYDNEVVMAYMMGNAFFGKGKYEWEVLRGATKLGYVVVGGVSKIWNYFINTYAPESCVYYIDYNYFNGQSLNYLSGMKYVETQQSFKNWWVNEDVVKNREPSKHKEIKELQLLGKVVPIYNAGIKVYLWKKN